MQAISLKEENGDSDQLEIRDLQEQMHLNQIAMNELHRRMQDVQQVY